MTQRSDFATIAQWIPPKARVLDLGCGDGTLLKFLKEERAIKGYGVEILDANVLACINNRVEVLQLDLEAGLSGFESHSFDYVILSQTLQAVRNTERIVSEMLRVGKAGIVTFPNFGYWHHRWQIFWGHMPVSRSLPYQWYNTPNIHLCTIKDFERFCEEHDIRITDRVIMRNGASVNVLPNLLGSLAVYRFQQKA